ncbi:MAG TPA: tetratricopeptide repeat protein [Pyrinomonadaceae bacterium]|nr:tetratricopeptide repeat protein [Pyrinomonadaceae bacterium]
MKVVSIALLVFLATAVIYAQAPSAVQIFMPDGSRPERELRFTLTRDDGRIETLFTDSKGKFQLTGDLNRDREYTFTIESDRRTFDTTTATLRLLRGGVSYLPIFLRPFKGDPKTVKGVVSALDATVPPEARTRYDRALKLIDEQRADEAISELKAAIKIHPSYVKALNDLGVLFLKLNRLDEAAESLQTATKIDERFYVARLNLGIVLNRQHKYEQAVSVLNNLYKVAPSLKGLRLALVEAWIGTGQLPLAEKALREAVGETQVPAVELVEIHYKLGVVLSRQDRYAEAVKELETATQLDPNAANAHLLLGAGLLELKRYPEAERELLTAYQLNRTEMGNAQLFLGQLYLAEQKYDSAQKALEQYLLDIPNAPNASQIRTTIDKLKARP